MHVLANTIHLFITAARSPECESDCSFGDKQQQAAASIKTNQVPKASKLTQIHFSKRIPKAPNDAGASISEVPIKRALLLLCQVGFSPRLYL